MTFHDPIEHSPHSSRVVSSRHEHNGSELMLVAPWRKYLAFTLGSNVGSGDFHDIRHAEPSQLANLPCARILVRQPAPDKLSSPVGGSVKTATRVAMPLCTR